MDNFTPLAASIGGALIGLSASFVLLFHGRIAGISGILGGMLERRPGDLVWRGLFVAGLIVGALPFVVLAPSMLEFSLDRSLPAIAAAGLLVGVGTRLGNGCTSGHGVCGLTRFSRRSLVATLTFMFTGAVSVFLVNHVLGGRL